MNRLSRALLIICCAGLALVGPGAQAEDVTASPQEGMEFREAPPARGPASTYEPMAGSDTSNAPPARPLVLPALTHPRRASRPTPPISFPAPGSGGYPWTPYNPDLVDSQTEGTVCYHCSRPPSSRSIFDHGRDILNSAVQQDQDGDPAETGNGNDFASRLQKGAVEAARKCRRFAKFKKIKKMSCQMWKNPETHMRKSKGLCATGVQEAFEAAGRTLGKGHGNGQDRNLKAAGMVPTAFNPNNLPGGSVLACNGPTKWGHIEIVVMKAGGQREFCSDFCSPRPTCGRGSYKKPRAFKWPGT